MNSRKKINLIEVESEKDNKKASMMYGYDVEVFKHQSFVVFKEMSGRTVRIFTNNVEGLNEYINRGIIEEVGFKGLDIFLEGKTLVGYNNYHYDDYILYAMSKGFSQQIIKEWSDNIIQAGSTVHMRTIRGCRTLDCYQQIDASRPGLKKIEGNMGRKIFESGVSFDLERPLTARENLEVVKYCEYDVSQTITIFKMRSNYYKTKERMIRMMEEDWLKEKAIKWNTTSIVGQLLKPQKRAPFRRLVENEMLELVPFEVRDMWRQLDNTIDFKFKKKKIIVDAFNNYIEFGWGGLHGAPKGFISRRQVKLLDVSSMYPSILVLLKGLGDKTLAYNRIKQHRLEIKHKDKGLSDAYKLILNSTYGLLNNQWSVLNHPYLAYSICIYGQIVLYELVSRLAGIGAEIVNINTDGVAFCFNGESDKRVWQDWEREFKLNLELIEYDRWMQKDVNNYIAVRGDEIKVKGGDVNKYHRNKFFANNDLRITHIALVDYLVRRKDIVETLIENLDNPLLFQYVLQAGPTYKGTFDKEGKLYNKINRVFATKKEGVELLKCRQDGGLVKFADAPEKMYLWNDDVDEIKDFDKIIDLQFYYDLINKNLKRWR